MKYKIEIDANDLRDLRKKTAENILDNDILQVEGETNRYRFNNKFEHVDDQYIKIIATKIEKVAYR